MRSLILALALVGCAHVNRATLAASSAALLCDWGQTRAAAQTGWRTTYEENPMLGASPSVTHVDAYMIGALATNAIVWAIMPERYKSAAPIGVLALEADPVSNNFHTTRGVCGI